MGSFTHCLPLKGLNPGCTVARPRFWPSMLKPCVHVKFHSKWGSVTLDHGQLKEVRYRYIYEAMPFLLSSCFLLWTCER